MTSSEGKKTVSELGLDHRNCSFSTDIADQLTAGQGKLDYYGWFEIPCDECAARVGAKIKSRSLLSSSDTEVVDK